MTSKLFSTLSLRELRLRNRIVISPMCQYSADDGSASAWHRTHLGTLSLSGAGMLLLEATAVEARGRITPGCLGLYSDANEAALAQTLAEIRRNSDMPIGVQLAHAGRKASSALPWKGGQQLAVTGGGWQTTGPSAVPYAISERPPLALDTAGLARVRAAFVDAAARAERLGLDSIELHCAHGYLLHSFLSPLANQRDDAYGGSTEHRMRFPLEVFDAVRAAWPAHKPLGVRVSASDWVEGGWDLAQTLVFAQALKARGCDWLDVSSGGVSPLQQIPLTPGYQLPFARAVRAATGITTMAVGLITEAAQAESVIADGDADMVALARAMLWDPRWPWHAAAALGATVQVPPQVWRCQPHGIREVFATEPLGPQ
jgi:2,4-dienoyl-CoA reductase-like NADH-dependent reductase (Old Yellow Enzyme family)